MLRVLLADAFGPLDQIIAMLGDLVDVFGKRFDKIERDMATKDQVVALRIQSRRSCAACST